jgi:hypothetical protein
MKSVEAVVKHRRALNVEVIYPERTMLHCPHEEREDAGREGLSRKSEEIRGPEGAGGRDQRA